MSFSSFEFSSRKTRIGITDSRCYRADKFVIFDPAYKNDGERIYRKCVPGLRETPLNRETVALRRNGICFAGLVPARTKSIFSNSR